MIASFVPKDTITGLIAIIEKLVWKIEIIKISARENLEKISLKEKSLIHRYNKYFEKCEKAQKETPKSFMLEWSK